MGWISNTSDSAIPRSPGTAEILIKGDQAPDMWGKVAGPDLVGCVLPMLFPSSPHVSLMLICYGAAEYLLQVRAVSGSFQGDIRVGTDEMCYIIGM